MKTIIKMLTISAALSGIEHAESPAVDALLQRVASFEQWGQRMDRKGDMTAAEAAFYQARKLRVEAGELRVAEADQRAEPVIQRLSLIVEEGFEKLSTAQSQVESRLANIEMQVSQLAGVPDDVQPPNIESLPEGLIGNVDIEPGEAFFNERILLNDGPGHPNLALIANERLEKLKTTHAEVSQRLKELERRITQRLENSNDGLRIVVDSIVGNFEELATQARKALDQLRAELADFGEQASARRDEADDDEPEEVTPQQVDGESPDLDSVRDRNNQRHRGSSERPRRIHLHAALQNLNAPPVHHHMHEAIEHLHAAGMHEVAEQLEHSMQRARERLITEISDNDRHRGHHRGHHHGHRDAQIEHLQDEVAALSERLERLEKALHKTTAKKKKKRKSRK